MPRKQYRADLEHASAPGLFPRLSHVRLGDDDGSIFFTYSPLSDAQTFDLQVLVSGKSPHH